MPIHLDVLGRLHVMLGALAVLAGVSLFVIALGTHVALLEMDEFPAGGEAGVWIQFWCGVLFAAAGAALMWTGRALARRRPAARTWALALAVPDLLAVPFGTALSVYAFWVLLNDEARREFGRPPRLPRRSPTGPGAPA
jgi:threonine/homoserine efflux transporter RhtA